MKGMKNRRGEAIRSPTPCAWQLSDGWLPTFSSWLEKGLRHRWSLNLTVHTELSHFAKLDVRSLGTNSTELTSEAVSLPSHMVNPAART
jgi:hypothetical protein